jgi:hypothetical protein
LLALLIGGGDGLAFVSDLIWLRNAFTCLIDLRFASAFWFFPPFVIFDLRASIEDRIDLKNLKKLLF